MSDKGEVNRFNRVDEQADTDFFVKFLDARKSISEDGLIKRQMVDWMMPLDGRRVLDVGCGTGDDSRAIAELVGPNGSVLGVDYSAKMVEEAQRRSANSTLPLEFRTGNAMELDLADGSFDYVRAERVLVHLSDPSKALREMLRVAASKGRVVTSELDLATIFADSPYTEVARTIIETNADTAQSGRVGRSLARLMREAGLRNVISQETVVHAPLALIRIAFAGHIDKCVREGRITGDDSARWWQHLEQADAAAELNFGGVVFTAAGEKP
jgi:ubiquinone/menaquinone biosynthesis C-methylase UbiE